MAELTDNFGLTKLGAGDDISENGYAVLGSNIETIDKAMALVRNHTHNGSTGLADPILAPELVLDSTSGNLPAGTEVRYRYTYIDQYGLETAGSPEASVITPSTLIPPGAPGASSVTTGGTLNGGLYYYGLSAYVTNDARETQLGGRISISVPFTTGTNVTTLTLPSIPVGSTGLNVYRRAPGEAEFTFLDTFTIGATPPTTYVDDGSATPNYGRRPQNKNLTASSNNVTITLPGATPSVPEGATWKIYRTYTLNSWTGSDLHHVVEETFTGSGIISPTYLDLGDGTGTDSIPEVSRILPQPPQITPAEIVRKGALPLSSIVASGQALVRGGHKVSTWANYHHVELAFSESLGNNIPGEVPWAWDDIKDKLSASPSVSNLTFYSWENIPSFGGNGYTAPGQGTGTQPGHEQRSCDLFIPCSAGEVLEIEPEWVFNLPNWAVWPVGFRYSIVVNGRTEETLSLQTTLNTDNVTSIVTSGLAPSNVPASGLIQVVDNNGVRRTLKYSSYSEATNTTWTIFSEDGSEDFASVNATAGNSVYIPRKKIKSSSWIAQNPRDSLFGVFEGTDDAKVRIHGMAQLLVEPWDLENGGVRIRPQTNTTANVGQAPKGTTTMTLASQPLDGDTLKIDYKTYTFKTTLDTSNNNGQVAIGGSVAATQTNLKACMECADPNDNSKYGDETTHDGQVEGSPFLPRPRIPHQSVTIGTWASNDVTLTAIWASVYNSLMTLDPQTSPVSFNPTVFTGGNSIGVVSGQYEDGLAGIVDFVQDGPKQRVRSTRRRKGVNLVLTGQSLNHAPGAVGGGNYGWRLQKSLVSQGYQVGLDNMAWSGSSFAARAQIERELKYRVYGFERNIVFIWGGYTDAVLGWTAQQIYDRKRDLAWQCKNIWGYDYAVALTVPDVDDAVSPGQAYWDHNALLTNSGSTDPGVFDVIVDIAALPDFTNVSGNGLVYGGDLLHFNSYGGNLVHQTVEPLILPLLSGLL